MLTAPAFRRSRRATHNASASVPERQARPSLTPLSRFSLVVASLLLVGSAVLSLLTAILMQRFILTETQEIVAGEVVKHLQVIFRPNIFEQPLTADQRKVFDSTVRLHLYIYKIVQVRFYNPSGEILYSFNPEQIGQHSPEGTLSDELAEALKNNVISRQSQLPANDNYTGRPVNHALEMYVPVVRDAQVVGVAEVYRDIGPLLTDIRTMQFAVTLVVFAGTLVVFLALRGVFSSSTQQIVARTQDLAVALDKIEATYSGTLFALGAALDTRDSETEGHSRRVVAGAVALGRAYGLDNAQLVELERGAQLHDVGKIGVPDAILRKAGPLTTEEWDLMRKHPDLGFQMLKNIHFLSGALPVVRHHHERYDGTGYPDKLAGADIPLHARIFTVVDSWDAMTSNRTYRKALAPEIALKEIQNGAGSQFDLGIVNVFEQLATNQLTVHWPLPSVHADPRLQPQNGA